jgi:predicted small lipoprotein YifL
MFKRKLFCSLILLLLFVVLFTACGHLTPLYNQNEYDMVVTLQTDSINLLQHASEESTMHKDDIVKVKKQMSDLYGYEKALRNNYDCLKQVKLLINPKGNLLGNALRTWEAGGRLTSFDILDYEQNIAYGFKQIIGIVRERRKE